MEKETPVSYKEGEHVRYNILTTRGRRLTFTGYISHTIKESPVSNEIYVIYRDTLSPFHRRKKVDFVAPKNIKPFKPLPYCMKIKEFFVALIIAILIMINLPFAGAAKISDGIDYLIDRIIKKWGIP